MDRQAYIVKLSVIYTACYMAALMTLVFVSVVIHLSGRFITGAFFATSATGFIVLVAFLRRARRVPLSASLSQRDARWIRWQIRLMKGFVVLLVLGLLAGLSEIRSNPIIGTVVAICINQLLMWTIIHAIKKLQSRLESNVTQSVTETLQPANRRAE